MVSGNPGAVQLILDEATASLNPLDEAAIIAAIEERKGEFATLTVAHRVSALLWVDEVLVLSGKTIAERGHPRDLLADPRSLFHLMAQQTRTGLSKNAPVDAQGFPAKGGGVADSTHDREESTPGPASEVAP